MVLLTRRAVWIISWFYLSGHKADILPKQLTQPPLRQPVLSTWRRLVIELWKVDDGLVGAPSLYVIIIGCLCGRHLQLAKGFSSWRINSVLWTTRMFSRRVLLSCYLILDKIIYFHSGPDYLRVDILLPLSRGVYSHISVSGGPAHSQTTLET